MGHIIERIAKERGHKISCVIDAENTADFDSEAFLKSDVAIEFTMPTQAVGNILSAFAANVPVVCGTTGWYDSLPEIEQLCNEGKGTLLYASNFSVGVNIFMVINRLVARMMNNFPEYTPSMTEVHHIHKLDHPSGTAITLAQEIIEVYKPLNGWAEPEEGRELKKDIFEISHRREGEVPGIHTVTWDSPVDSITLTHSAKSREGFAMGAVLAAEWLKNKRGLFTFSDVISDAL